MHDEFHPIQRKILNDLLFADKLKYSQLKPEDMEGSQFTFHLNRLLAHGLLLKNEDLYALSAHGKDVANTFDTDSAHPRKQAKQSVVFCAFRTTSGRVETLIYTRKKNPFYDHQGYPTGKVMFGESMLETAERELYEETGLTGKAFLTGIRHFRVYYPTPSDLVEDKVMYICRIDSPSGILRSNEEGIFEWVYADTLLNSISNPLPEFAETYAVVSHFAGVITFDEQEHYPKVF